MAILTNLILLAIMLDGIERRTSSDQNLSVCPVIKVLRFRLMQLGWIGEREDGWAVNVLCHFAHDFFSKSAWLGRCTDQNVWLNLLHHGEKIAVVFSCPLAVLAGVSSLCWGELVFLAF